MFRPQDLVFKVDYLLKLRGRFRVSALSIQGERNVIARPECVGMFGSERLFPDRENAAMLGLGFGGFAAVIEGNGETVPRQQSIGVHWAEKFFFRGDDGAEACDRVVVLSLAILGIRQSSATAQRVGVVRAQSPLPRFGCSAQHLFGLAIRPLLQQHFADALLNVRPLRRVPFAIGKLFGGAKIFQGAFELDPFLSSEASELVSLNDLDRKSTR